MANNVIFYVASRLKDDRKDSLIVYFGFLVLVCLAFLVGGFVVVGAFLSCLEWCFFSFYSQGCKRFFGVNILLLIAKKKKNNFLSYLLFCRFET